MIRIIGLITLIQGILALRVFYRMARSANGSVIGPTTQAVVPGERVSVLLPALDEQDRIEACLNGLALQGSIVKEIFVIDGGSTDETVTIAERVSKTDQRVRVEDASPVPSGVNGKAYGLSIAEPLADTESEWILVIDADVRPESGMVAALVAKANSEGIDVLSVATQQQLSGWAEGLIHPSMLATLVYRFGIPGHIFERVEQVQANGQCLLIRRGALNSVGGFQSVVHANAEDVTLVRSLVNAGYPAGFFESEGLVSVEMYSSWREAWVGWSRSLPMKDRFSTWRFHLSLLEIFLVQAAPTLLWPFLVVMLGLTHPLTMIQSGLLIGRIGVLAGMRRAYIDPPRTYWFSPLFDLAVAFRLLDMSRRSRFTWRGRELNAGEDL